MRGLFDKDDRLDVSENERPNGCYACGHEGVPLKKKLMAGQPKWLCSLCYSTLAGTAAAFPVQFPMKDEMFVSCFVGNEILLAIRDLYEVVIKRGLCEMEQEVRLVSNPQGRA